MFSILITEADLSLSDISFVIVSRDCICWIAMKCCKVVVPYSCKWPPWHVGALRQVACLVWGSWMGRVMQIFCFDLGMRGWFRLMIDVRSWDHVRHTNNMGTHWKIIVMDHRIRKVYYISAGRTDRKSILGGQSGVWWPSGVCAPPDQLAARLVKQDGSFDKHTHTFPLLRRQGMQMFPKAWGQFLHTTLHPPKPFSKLRAYYIQARYNSHTGKKVL